MRKYNGIYIAFAVIGLFGLLGFLFFEVREIPDIKWMENIDYESEEAYGTWLLKSMIEKKYGEENVIDLSEDFAFDSTDNKSLYLFVGNSSMYEKRKYEKLDSFLSLGHSALIISNNLEFPRDTLSNSPYDLLDFEYDSTLVLNSCLDSSLDFTFHSYKKDLLTPKVKEHHYLYPDVEDYLYEAVLCSGDSMLLFVNDLNYDYQLAYHFIPEAFVNVAAINDAYLDHFNFVFSKYDVDKVYLDKPKNHGYVGQDENTSPLKYVLSEPSLAWAYFLTILTGLFFVLFGGKRKQRVIPIVEKNVNSSLEYVEVLSELFMAQNQNQKLVLHIKDNFNHKIAKQYFLKPGTPELNENLARKSGIPIDRIKNIFYFFKKAEDKFPISDEELNKLHNQLEYFNQNAI